MYVRCSIQFGPIDIHVVSDTFPITKLNGNIPGTHPSVADGEVEVTLLQAGSDEEIIAKVKNCYDEYYVYKLQPTSACPEAYCFGENI